MRHNTWIGRRRGGGWCSKASNSFVLPSLCHARCQVSTHTRHRTKPSTRSADEDNINRTRKTFIGTTYSTGRTAQRESETKHKETKPTENCQQGRRLSSTQRPSPRRHHSKAATRPFSSNTVPLSSLHPTYQSDAQGPA